MKLILLLFLLFIQVSMAKSGCIKYGVIPYSSISLIEQSYAKWKEYIENSIGKCVNISFESTYSELIVKFTKGELDMAFVGPFSYVLIKNRVAVEPLVSGVTADGKSTYQSFMVATPKVAQALKITTPYKGSDGMLKLQKKLSSYKKKWILAFTDESSTSGYAIPNYYMKKAFIDIDEYFKKIAFVGTHDAAQLAVKNDVIPIAFSASMFYNRLLNEKKITKDSNVLLWESDEIPKSLIIIQKKFPKEFKQKLQKVLVNTPISVIPKISKEVGYIQADEEKYKHIEKINRYLQ